MVIPCREALEKRSKIGGHAMSYEVQIGLPYILTKFSYYGVDRILPPCNHRFLD